MLMLLCLYRFWQLMFLLYEIIDDNEFVTEKISVNLLVKIYISMVNKQVCENCMKGPCMKCRWKTLNGFHWSLLELDYPLIFLTWNCFSTFERVVFHFVEFTQRSHRAVA